MSKLQGTVIDTDILVVGGGVGGLAFEGGGVSTTGGVGFSRLVEEIEFGVGSQTFTTRSIQYGVGPVVGAEARIAVTAHARLLAGVRLHALGLSPIDGWILRPGGGLSWSF